MSGPQTGPPQPALWWLPVVGAIATIGLQILWPLADGQSRTSLTIITVVIFAATSVIHSGIYLGARWAAGYLAITVGLRSSSRQSEPTRGFRSRLMTTPMH